MAVKATPQPLTSSNGYGPLKAVLYARVSSEEQRERQSIETQIDFARQQCEREGISLLDIYRDEGVSGTIPFEDRPEGKRLLADARQKQFTVVLVYKVDRLGRADVVSHVARHHLETLGVGLRSLTEPFDTATAQGRFMFSMLVANSAMERENIRERSIAGTNRVVKQGKWAAGRPPYGYRIDADGRLAISENPLPGFSFSEADVVRMIFHWAAEERLPLLAIAAKLNDMGVPTSSLTEGRKRKHRAGTRKAYMLGVWQIATVSHILHRTTYTGVRVYGTMSKKPDRERITQTVPAIISPALWDRAQDALRRNLQWAKRNAQHHYLLTGLMRCGLCGKRFQAATPGPRKPYYRCGGTMKHNCVASGVACRSRRLPLTWIEDLVWEELKDWIVNHQNLEAVMAEALQEQAQKRQHWVDSLARIKRDLGQAETQRGRILTAYRKGLASEADLEQQLTELKAETQHLQQVAAELDKRLSLTVDLDTAVTAIRNQLEAFRKALQKKTVPFPVKRKIVETFVNEVVVTLERGSSLEVTTKEILPFRPEISRSAIDTAREIVWQRPGSKGQPQSNQGGQVQILYRFPFPPQPKTLVSITSPTAVSIESTHTQLPCCGWDLTTRA